MDSRPNEKRIGLPISEKIKYPIWVRYQWQGTKHKRPDLRFSGHLEKGTKGIFLELEVETENVLLSGFDDFNNILNYGYIADNEEEFDKFYNELESYGYCHYDLQSINIKSDIFIDCKLGFYESWEKIFDLERERGWWESHVKKEEKYIQATMREVKWEQVVSIL